jgi:hypothetical protein
MHPTSNSQTTRPAEAGIALLSALLVLMLMSAMLVGFLALIMSDQRAGYRNRDQTTAYAAAHGGLEQLTANLGQLFAVNFRPTSAQVLALAAAPPVFPAAMGISFQSPGGGPGYQITFADANNDGFPDTEPQPRMINEGEYQGLQGVATPFQIEVTARTASGGEARMRREMFTMLIPAFQFGVFSENDLSFFAGPNFDFGGRVHTNQNLFLAQGNGTQLWLRDRVTVVGEVVRLNLSNGWSTTANYTGTVRIARYAGDTTGDTLLRTEGSWAAAEPQLPPAPVTGVTPAPGENTSPNWTTTSTSKFRGNIKNARTGAKPLVLPMVQMGAAPITLIRRPVVDSDEDTTNPAIFGQRYFARASLRILLSDQEDDLLDLPGVTNTLPVRLENLVAGGAYGWYGATQAPAATAPALPSGYWNATSNTLEPLPLATGMTAAEQRAAHYPGNRPAGADDYFTGGGTWVRANEPIVKGFIKIEMQRQDLTWVDVTQDILELGFTGRRLSLRNPGATPGGVIPNLTDHYINNFVWGSTPNNNAAPPCADPSPNAIIRLQRVRDDHNPLHPCGLTAVGNTPSQNRWDYLPNVLVDPREGNLRDNNANNMTTVSIGGVMHYVEIDARNVARWFAGQIGAGNFGPQAEFSDGGYLVYFSDRRSNQRVGGIETGELGFEDFVNPLDGANGAPNNTLDQGEDVNGLDSDNDGNNLDVYGGVPIVPGNLRNGAPVPAAMAAQASSREARTNPAIFFRRALKIVNGAGTAADPNVSPFTVMPAGRGMTIASENPVYIQGNFNTGTNGAFGATQNDHRPAAVIADAVTLLSNNWSDLRSMTYLNAAECPANPNPVNYPNTCYGSQDPVRRKGFDTSYRTAIVAGKGLSFLRPGWANQDFGTDGGAHNFLRYIEDWDGTINYRGSIVSFYVAQQAVGTYKCCTNVYSPPTRGYRFDTEFLTLSLLPPKSPAFRDVNTYSFRQVLRPTQ